ncbi:DUF4333 domain-containing protein [Mycobacterium deserti]|uniref:DUF4333 domain-containing protein n=1 Tax=Mycobacterium deserti TaxID=2978347 RepID=A0ABT2MF72_9MYCO|nr:DUF4333 domain-containing protein [Mycobacterium deserti]MCT7660040.1 DUF4333 domain-containing protein [Mycobacterium deserti]
MRTETTALAAMVAAVALVCGCDFDARVNPSPTVSKNALQSEITDRLAAAGEKPQSVTCKEDLIGEVGSSARCEVVISPTNSFEPVVTITAVDGNKIDYEMTPAVSKEQLEQTVSRLVAETGARVDSVTCETGLDGTVGATAHCDVTSDGAAVRRTVAVNNVDGLLMNFDLLPI